ncbi:hypothetical protein G6F57_009328 [Rhizopus arrhizus]|uniref:Uncharacterized protein n=1 Tax=Rhizopus oryzae TaxID=64495 RepID=A0A9P6X3I8_RHIOR|nr:hypothetical protein G6F33_010450 [Rhizopus arrhizus]KAG1415934.1 hypothetical protein G6F58_006227 [Rhizopus delemar]KAG0953095.1 hypothetical protein G6F30_000233 [Rhizopus arrhizus]KAG0958694.1 hypothetical protein G6F32_000076 [Rhizopus arrhizus]KAG0977322.1 hypothetical protein G6F29_010157 [Rhizopus arrhizus]
MGKVSTSQMAIVSDSRRLSSPIPITAISMEDKTNEIIITGPRSNLFSNRKILDSRDYRSLADPKRVIFGISWRPNLDNDLYNRHVDLHDEVSYPLSNTVVDYVSFVVNSPNIIEFKKNLRQLPDAEDNVVDFLEEVLRSSHYLYSTIQNIEDGEAMFNDILLYPFLKAVCVASNAGVPQFKVGETQLRAMSKKTNESEIESDESTLYKADGIMSFYGFNRLEVLLLETSGHFGSSDNSKSSFDHHKGLFGALSMIKASWRLLYCKV